MADVNVKTIETRLQLKYDTYANWTDESKAGLGGNLVLLPGEIGICAIGDTAATGSAQATTNPTVLFKVGDGVTPFKTLKWASALAADVYGWAKSETVSFNADNKKVEFKTGETVIHSVDLSHFAEASTVADHADRLTDIEAALGLEGGEGTESVSAQIANIVERLGVIQGADTVDGSIAKALKDAKAYTDEKLGTAAVGTEGADDYVAATGIRKEIADAQAAAIAAANANTAAEVGELDAKDSELLGKIGENTTAIGNEATARQEADKAITDMIGTGFEATETGTVAAKVKAAQDAADAAQADVDALTAAEGAVTKNTAAVAQLTSDLATETSERKAADEGLDARLKEVEAFFEGAAKDGEGLDNALDKLVEIQNLLSTEEGAAAGDLLDAITELQEIVGKEAEGEAEATGLVKDMADAKADLAGLKTDVATLQDIVDGYTDKGSIKTAIEAAQTQADKGVEDAGKAQAAADAAQEDVDDLAAIVGNEAVGTAGQEGYKEATGLIKLINEATATADDAQARVAAVEPRIEQAEKDIDAIEAVVLSGENTNAQLRSDIDALEAIVVTGADNNEALGAEIDAIAAKVNDETTGLAKTYEIADDAQKRVAAIEADYLKASDVYVFNCGSSTTVTHVAPAAN